MKLGLQLLFQVGLWINSHFKALLLVLLAEFTSRRLGIDARFFIGENPKLLNQACSLQTLVSTDLMDSNFLGFRQEHQVSPWFWQILIWQLYPKLCGYLFSIWFSLELVAAVAVLALGLLLASALFRWELLKLLFERWLKKIDSFALFSLSKHSFQTLFLRVAQL